VLLSAATLALAWPRAPTAPPPPALALLCRGAADELAEAWDDAARARLGTALRGAGPRGAQVWAAVEPQLDAYAAAWVEMRTDACEATRLRGEQSEPLLDLRVACLDRRRDRLRALVAELVPLGPSDPDRVAQAVPRLTGLGCADVAALTARCRRRPIPPCAPASTEFTTQLARLKARADTGQYAEVAAEGAPLLATLQELGYLPRYAEACLLVGEARAQAGDLDGARAALADAALAAEAARHDAVAARAWTVLTFVAGFSAGDAAAGAVAARRADAAVRRLGDPAEPRGRLELNLGAIAYGSATSMARSPTGSERSRCGPPRTARTTPTSPASTTTSAQPTATAATTPGRSPRTTTRSRSGSRRSATATRWSASCCRTSPPNR
jgi:hypothetical protein